MYREIEYIQNSRNSSTWRIPRWITTIIISGYWKIISLYPAELLFSTKFLLKCGGSTFNNVLHAHLHNIVHLIKARTNRETRQVHEPVLVGDPPCSFIIQSILAMADAKRKDNYWQLEHRELQTQFQVRWRHIKWNISTKFKQDNASFNSEVHGVFQLIGVYWTFSALKKWYFDLISFKTRNLCVEI